MQSPPLATSDTLTIPKEVTEQESKGVTEQPTPKMSLRGAMKLISSSYKKGDITKVQLAELRKQLGIPSSFFTKKKTKAEVKKNRKKMADASRKRNRGQGKGQKRNNGHFGSKAK